MSYETKAYPATGPIIHDGMNLIDYFACHAPQPLKADVVNQMRLDHQNNPYNEDHKPQIRDRIEIEIELRYKWASQMMKERERWI